MTRSMNLFPLVFGCLAIGFMGGIVFERFVPPGHADPGTSPTDDVHLARVAAQDIATSMKELPKLNQNMDRLIQEVAKTRDTCKK